MGPIESLNVWSSWESSPIYAVKYGYLIHSSITSHILFNKHLPVIRANLAYNNEYLRTFTEILFRLFSLNYFKIAGEIGPNMRIWWT